MISLCNRFLALVRSVASIRILGISAAMFGCLGIFSPDGTASLQAQTVALRTNALLWGAEAANVGLDFTINDFSTLGVSGVYSFRDSWIHETNVRGLQLEYRYWFTHQPFYGLFVGPVAGIFHYRIHDDATWQYTVPAGLQFGYAWSLSKHWNLEALYGVGYLFYNRETPYTHSTGLEPDFPSEGNSAISESVSVYTQQTPQYTKHHKFTTINLGLSLSYVF